MTGKLPSQMGTASRAFDESYTRGFAFGRQAGLEAACQIIRDLPMTPQSMQLIELFTKEKYHVPSKP